MRRLRKLLRLPPNERYLLITAYGLLVVFRGGLNALPFRWVNRLLTPATSAVCRLWRWRFGSAGLSAVPVTSIARAVYKSSRFQPGDAKCLARALTAQVLLTSFGYTPRLRIGVAKSADGSLEAHAWIEEQGQVVMGHLDDLDRYQVLSAGATPALTQFQHFIGGKNANN